MISWRPVPDISAPIRIIHLDVDELGAERREALAAPYFLILWRDSCPIAQFKTFCSSEPPLDWRMVERACEALTAAPTPQASRSNISLVICTRDRPQDLDRCLASLPSQNRRPDQVVVVDNASRTDETRQVTERHGVVYVREDRPGLDIARNRGAAVSRGDIVAYTDDDTVLHPCWLRQIEDAFDAKEIWSVTGLVLPAELETEAQCLFEKVWSFGRGLQRRDFGPLFYSDTRKRGSPAWEVGRRQHGLSPGGVRQNRWIRRASRRRRSRLFRRLRILESNPARRRGLPVRTKRSPLSLPPSHPGGTQGANPRLYAGPCRGLACSARTDRRAGEPAPHIPVASNLVLPPGPAMAGRTPHGVHLPLARRGARLH
jgi:hypothetical protein